MWDLSFENVITVCNYIYMTNVDKDGNKNDIALIPNL